MGRREGRRVEGRGREGGEGRGGESSEVSEVEEGERECKCSAK